MITDFSEKYHMLPQGSRVLCAVSGGADSMCLLHWLWSNSERLNIKVLAAHFDHQLRGMESARDRTFVKDWCAGHDIECAVGFGQVRRYAEDNRMGTEEAARVLRYEFLESTAQRLGCDKIATAHNADDNAETVLLNLTRGTGPAGLRGIPPVRGRIIRPLLATTRSEILTYLKENSVPHVEDSTNETDDYSRNLIRHHVMPVLREINPGFTANVGRTAELLRGDEKFFSDAARSFADENLENNSLPIDKMRALPEPVSARVLRLVSPKALEKEHVERVLGLIKSEKTAFADLPGIRITAERGRLYFGQPELCRIEDILLIINGVTPIPGTGFEIKSEIIEKPREINSSFKTYYFKYDSICGIIFCTCRRDGDKIRLLGRGCTKSLKDLFNESKMTRAEKAATPVLRDDNGPVAVYGFGMAERCAAGYGDRVLRINIEKTGETKNVG